MRFAIGDAVRTTGHSNHPLINSVGVTGVVTSVDGCNPYDCRITTPFIEDFAVYNHEIELLPSQRLAKEYLEIQNR